ncbi:serine protease [Streptomyces hydrogenans]|uniref:serine protease n=1 Tax=Streptomyces hydrogenans TaxID=1873719 RepID=UPI0036B7F8E1
MTRGRGRFGPAASVLGAMVLAAGLTAGGTGTATAVVGGTDATAGAYPYQAALMKQGPAGWQQICGGSIIGDRWILTAAHCVEGTAADRMAVGVGTHTLDSGGTAYRVQEAIRHQDYNGNAAGSPNDIALLKLTTPLTYTPLVQPIALPDPLAYPSGTATLTGWGYVNGNGTDTSVLQQATPTLLAVADCQTRWMGQNITAKHLCTYDKGSGVTACEGDSGGPLAQNGRVIGIVSWGTTNCSGQYPSVYTNVAAYRTWITTKTGI